VLAYVLTERYRCPEKLCEFTLSGEHSSDGKPFRYVDSVVSHRRTFSRIHGQRPVVSLVDLAHAITTDCGRPHLPFDPNEIIEDLRLERYVDAWGSKLSARSVLRRLYYVLRPFMSFSMRGQIQRLYTRTKREQTFPHWPVDTTVEDLCQRFLLIFMEAAGLDEIPFIWFWPRRARGCVMMAHDVETEAGRDA